MSDKGESFTQRSKDEIVSGGQTGALKDIDKKSEGSGENQADGLNVGKGKDDAANAIPQTGKPK